MRHAATFALLFVGLVTSAPANEITCLAVAPKDELIAIGATDGTVRIVDLAKLAAVRIVKGGRGDVLRLAWSSNGKTLAAGTFDGMSSHGDAGWESIDAPAEWKAWDVGSRRELLDERRKEPGHDDPGLAFRGDGKVLVTWGCGRLADVFDLERGERTRSLDIEGEQINCAVWTSDPDRVATGDDKGLVRVWNPNTGTIERSFKWAADSVRCIAYSAEAHRLIAGGDGPHFASWDTESWSKLWTTTDSNGNLFSSDVVVSVTIDARHDRLVTATNAWGALQLHSLSTGALLWNHDFGGGNWAKLYASIDPAGDFVASFGLDCCRAAQVFRADSGTAALELNHARGGAGSVSWTADGRYLVVREQDIHVFDGRTLRDLFSLRLTSDGVERVP